MTKFTSPCLDQGQSLNQWAVGPTTSAYIMGTRTKVCLCRIQYTYTGVRSPRALQRWDALLPATDPFFHDAGVTSIRVRQQAHGMTKSQPRSSSYLLDPTLRDPSNLHYTIVTCGEGWSERRRSAPARTTSARHNSSMGRQQLGSQRKKGGAATHDFDDDEAGCVAGRDLRGRRQCDMAVNPEEEPVARRAHYRQ
jgi:hypothetical protein